MHVKTKDHDAVKMLAELGSLLVSINGNLSQLLTVASLTKDNAGMISWHSEKSKERLVKMDQRLVGLENSLSMLSFRMGEIAGTMARQQKMMEKLYGIENTK